MTQVVCQPPAKHFYFDRYQARTPATPLVYHARREWWWKILAIVSVATGAAYLIWRWAWSLPPGALWFAIPVALAESAAYAGLVLFYYDVWEMKDPAMQAPPATIGECDPEANDPQRPIAVDVFITTYNEDPELVRLSVRDARRIHYPHALRLEVYVLDDGRRETMAAMARQEGVNYLSRPDNLGFKAGNLRHAMQHTSGDFILICDADTRPFPTILEHTLGYFRDVRVAWVQTPQWFYDLPEGRPLADWLGIHLGRFGSQLGGLAERWLGPIAVGTDPYGSDARAFYDVVQRRRNRAYASFCCGAASVHRRDAVMRAALKSYATAVQRELSHRRHVLHRTPDVAQRRMARHAAAASVELAPFVLHVSEDIYTSIVLHSDRSRPYRSILHAPVESRMLSPQDLASWMTQQFKYAGGTLDIALHDNPVLRAGMPWRHRLMYASTIWSYLGVIAQVVLLIAPIVYLFTGIAPVKLYSGTFVLLVVPFLVANELALMLATWGLSVTRYRAIRLGMFPLVLRALWTVLRRRPIRFAVTPKVRQEGVFPELVRVQLGIMLLTLGGIVFALGSLALSSHPSPMRIAGVLINGFWGLHNVLTLRRIVFAAWHRPTTGPLDPKAERPEGPWVAALGHLTHVAALLLVSLVVVALDR